MNLKATLALTGAALVTTVALAGAASAGSAAKPGFEPGSWQGVGKISGTTGDGPMSETWSGTVRFKVVVSKSLGVGGSGTWGITMKGTGPVSSTLKGTAALNLSGTATDVRYAGSHKVVGTVSDGVHSTPISFTRPLRGRLVVTRAWSCRVVGTSLMGGGLTFTWTATKGTGTCR